MENVITIEGVSIHIEGLTKKQKRRAFSEARKATEDLHPEYNKAALESAYRQRMAAWEEAILRRGGRITSRTTERMRVRRAGFNGWK